MSLNIRKKLFIGLFTVIFLFLVVITLKATYTQIIFYKSQKKIELLLVEMEKVSDSEHAMERVLMPGNDYIITGDKRYEDEFRKESEKIDRLLKDLELALSAIGGKNAREFKEEKEILGEVRILWKNLQETSLQIFALPEPVGSAVGRRLMEEMDYKWGRPASIRLARWHDLEMDVVKEAVERINVALVQALYGLGATFIILVASGVFLSFFYSTKFVRSIKELHNGVERIAGGDLDYRVNVKTGDEIEQLSNQFNMMGERLKESYSTLEEKIKERTKELKHERDKLEGVFIAMEDGVYVVNQGYDIQYINPALEKDFGPWEGRKCYEYFHGRAEICPWCPNNEVFKGKTIRWEWHSVKNGKTYDLLDTMIKNADGTLSKLEIFRDISGKVLAQKALKESEEKYRVMIEESNDLIWVLDVSGMASFINRRVEEASGYTFEELKVQAHPYIIEEDLPIVKDAFQKVMKGEKVAYEARVRKKDGGVLFLSINSAPIIKDGAVVGKISFGRDITEERLVTAELKERVGELERFMKVAIDREKRIKELSEDIERLKKEKG